MEKMNQAFYRQPWRLVPNQIRAEGGRELERFRGALNARDTQNGAEAWIGSVTRANGVTPQNPNLGCSEVWLPDGQRRYLFEVVNEAPLETLGQRHVSCFGRELGLLIKLLDAKAPFILQCHPSRAVAKALWDSDYGKEECWHVLSVRRDVLETPYILLGFKPGITRRQFEADYRRHDMEALKRLCHRIEVKPGETYFVPAGMPHALGSGCFVIELQEPSDLTAVPVTQDELISFRAHANPKGVFPRMDDGLYEQRMLESFNYTGYPLETVLQMTRSQNPVIRQAAWGREEQLIGPAFTPYFSCSQIVVEGEAPLPATGDICIGLVTAGSGRLMCREGALALTRGSEVFFPWNVPDARLCGHLTMVLCRPSIPPEKSPSEN